MAHNLTTDKNGNTLFQSFRKDCWHRLGQVFNEPRTASEAWAAFDDPFSILKLPLTRVDGNLSPIYEITKLEDRGFTDSFGFVKESYYLVDHQQYCEAWDAAVATLGDKLAIETIGVLGNGSRMFVLAPMPDIEIAGEEHKNFIVGVNDATGMGANLLKITDVRVVCQNTLNASLRDMESVFKVDHDSFIIENMTKWISDVLGTAKQKAETLKQALEIMTLPVLEDERIPELLNATIKIPAPPKKTGSSLYDNKLYEQYEQRNAVALARQGTIKMLYEGGMTGYADLVTRNIERTPYAAYCAVTEAMDHVVPGRGDSNQTYVDGWRSQVKDSAFRFLLDLSRN